MNIVVGPADGGLVGTYRFGLAEARVGVAAQGEICSADTVPVHEIELLHGDSTGQFPGRGRALLEEICRRADESGCTLVLNVSPSGKWRGDLEDKRRRLRELYALYGFLPHPSRTYALTWLRRGV